MKGSDGYHFTQENFDSFVEYVVWRTVLVGFAMGFVAGAVPTAALAMWLLP